MTLPASGQISFNNLRIELNVSAQAPFSIKDAATGVYATINTNSPSFPNASAPHSISEWYSYNHTAAPPPTCQSLNSGVSLRYSTITPTPSVDTCNSAGNDYSNSQVFYSNDCTTLGSGCTVYAENTCTSTAYNLVTARYITDDANYFGLNASSVVSSTGGCID